MSRKAEMGVGTLIVFIAFLLVAAVAAGVLISTANSLQERALATGQQAEGQIASHALVVEVSATDGLDGTLDDFTSIMKLASGSDPIKLDDVLFTFNTVDKTASLTYAGTDATTNNAVTGYYTLRETDIATTFDTTTNASIGDWDLDKVDDAVSVANSSHLAFYFSTDGLAYAGGALNLSLVNSTQAVNGASIISATDGSTLGTLTLDAYIYTANTIQDNQTCNVTPAKEGDGFFSVEYIQEGTNFRAGNLQRGDIVKLYYEAPGSIGEDQEVRLNFIPKIGTTTLTEFVTPDVIAVERVYLYP